GDDSRAPIIELGSAREFTADRNGRLYLTANRGSYADARGSFNVQIRSERSQDAYDRAQDYPGRGRARDRDNRDTRDTRDRRRTPQEVTINVPGTSRGTDTGIDVRAGDQITFSATGTIGAGRRA